MGDTRGSGGGLGTVPTLRRFVPLLADWVVGRSTRPREFRRGLGRKIEGSALRWLGWLIVELFLALLAYDGCVTVPTSLPAAHGMSGVLLFGGMFDPPHAGHLSLAVRVRDEVMGAQTQLVFVPAARSPHKSGGAIATDEQRLKMLGLAIGDVPRCSIWTDEIDRGGTSYWVDTLVRARSQLGESASLRFLIGADQAIAFHRWRANDKVLGLAEPIVMLRDPIKTVQALIVQMHATGAWDKEGLKRWSTWVWDGGCVDASSAEVRERAKHGARLDDLDPLVRSFIETTGLYGGV